MKRFLFLCFALLFLVPASAATLTVTVHHIEKKGGLLHVALYNEGIWDDENADPLMDRIVPAVAPETSVTFEHVAPGTYGVKTYQDVNENDKFDQDMIGIPEERFGFSRDAKPGLGQPFFDRCAIKVEEDKHTSIDIHLQ